MKKILVVLALVVSTMTVSYAYPADQEVWAQSTTYVNFKNTYKTINATCNGTIDYTFEIRNYGKAFIKIWKVLDSDLLLSDQFSGGTSVNQWRFGTFNAINKYIGTVQVEVQIDPPRNGIKYDNFASTRWEW